MFLSILLLLHKIAYKNIYCVSMMWLFKLINKTPVNKCITNLATLMAGIMWHNIERTPFQVISSSLQKKKIFFFGWKSEASVLWHSMKKTLMQLHCFAIKPNFGRFFFRETSYSITLFNFYFIFKYLFLNLIWLTVLALNITHKKVKVFFFSLSLSLSGPLNTIMVVVVVVICFGFVHYWHSIVNSDNDVDVGDGLLKISERVKS